MSARLRYVSADEHSARWDGFAFRDGDMQMDSLVGVLHHVPDDRWPALVEAATFAAMRRRSAGRGGLVAAPVNSRRRHG